jgi:hypothetical protein
MAFGAGLQAGNRLLGAAVRPMGSALSSILKPFRQMPVNETFGGEDDFSVLHARFKYVANLDVHLCADMLRNHNLKFVFYGDEIHTVACFHSLTVQQYNWAGHRQTVIGICNIWSELTPRNAHRGTFGSRNKAHARMFLFDDEEFLAASVSGDGFGDLNAAKAVGKQDGI